MTSNDQNVGMANAVELRCRGDGVKRLYFPCTTLINNLLHTKYPINIDTRLIDSMIKKLITRCDPILKSQYILAGYRYFTMPSIVAIVFAEKKNLSSPLAIRSLNISMI